MALKAEKALQRAGLTVRMVPTPRQYATDCGFALRFDWAEAGRVPGLLEGAGVETAGVRPLY